MRTIAEDAMDLSFGFVSGFLQETLLQDGPYEDAMDLSFGFVSGELETILILGGLYEDEMDLSFGFVSGLLEDKLVSIYAPDEALQMSITLDSLSMTAV